MANCMVKPSQSFTPRSTQASLVLLWASFLCLSPAIASTGRPAAYCHRNDSRTAKAKSQIERTCALALVLASMPIIRQKDRPESIKIMVLAIFLVLTARSSNAKAQPSSAQLIRHRAAVHIARLGSNNPPYHLYPKCQTTVSPPTFAHHAANASAPKKSQGPQNARHYTHRTASPQTPSKTTVAIKPPPSSSCQATKILMTPQIRAIAQRI